MEIILTFRELYARINFLHEFIRITLNSKHFMLSESKPGESYYNIHRTTCSKGKYKN